MFFILYKLSSLSQKIWKNIVQKEKKILATVQVRVHKSVTQGCKLWPLKQWLQEHFESVPFRTVWFFHKIIYCIVQVVEMYCFNNLCFPSSLLLCELMKLCAWLGIYNWVIIYWQITFLSEHDDTPFYFIFRVSLPCLIN